MKEEKQITPINEDLKVAIYEVEEIKQKIHTIRGKQVMIDSDVAKLYQYKTKSLNLAVKRNIERFPEEFCFQLTESEYECLRFQIETLNKNKRGQHKKYLPYVFTEQGVAMLSGVLKSSIAVKMSINIIKAFIEMRKFLVENREVFERLINVEQKLLEQDKKFDEVFNQLQNNKEDEFKQKIFFKGQIWDAYNLIIEIIKKAEKKITLIDNYIDDSILDMFSKKKKDTEVVILTSYHTRISNLDIKKFNKEYPKLKIIKTNIFHDRFIVIDNKYLYHCGASLKDLGQKCFAINKIENMDFIEYIKEKEQARGC